MGKVKSAIITALLVAAILVLSLFATVSCDIQGGVKRYNSFLSSIHLGSDFTGDVCVLYYPEGVISRADYDFVVNDDDENNAEQKKKYENSYERRGSVYVERDKLGYAYDSEKDAYDLASRDEAEEQKFIESVAADAKVMAARFGEKEYSSFSVTVEDSFTVKVTVPSNYTWSAYRDHDTTASSSQNTLINNTMTYFAYDGELGFRDTDTFSTSKSLVSVRDDFASFFKGAKFVNRAGTTAIQIDVTNAGFENINKAFDNYKGSAENAYFYIGETCLGLTCTIADGLETKTLYYSPENVNKSTVQDMALLLNSVIGGQTLVNEYEYDSFIPVSANFGEYGAVYLFAGLLAIIVAAIVASCIRYKKLGLVNSLIILVYALTMVLAIQIIEIQVTMLGAFTAVMGLALLLFSNFYLFEAVRKETKLGRTMAASIKVAYKNTLTTILDAHILLFVAAFLLMLIGVGEVASCGFIFFIAVLASYALFWFTRFMWYVISSLAKNRSYSFGGFETVEEEDEN